VQKLGLRQSHPLAVTPPSRALAVEALEDRTVLSTLNYSTFLGGNGGDEAFAVAADAAGNTYVTGMTSSANFPGTAGGFDPWAELRGSASPPPGWLRGPGSPVRVGRPRALGPRAGYHAVGGAAGSR
jgi:Beta-propeller repeat